MATPTTITASAINRMRTRLRLSTQEIALMRVSHSMVALVVIVLLLVLAPAAGAADVPPGAAWSEATITEADGTKLHADILRPKDLPDTAKVPVILSIGPYFNHSGQTGPAGPVEGTSFDPAGPSTGPSDRFYDFVNGGKLMERGYAYVMVDLRGYGGSTGCLDWVGPGEQADVKAAVEWAASQPWSTGRVGMYGKSYDGVTGLVGLIQKPKGLAAVVAQEPVYDMYRYLYANGIRYPNSAATPALYDAIAATPGPLLDDPFYNINGLTDPVCLATNYLAQQSSDHASDYWKARDLIAKAGTADTPLFLTQGFLEFNTDPDGTWDFFNATKGPKRAWFGMWDHVRGNDTNADGRLLMGRPGWFDEVMRFYDHFVREVPLADAPTDADPPVAVQTSDGTWRSEAAWPPADVEMLETQLRTGEYLYDGIQTGASEGAAQGGIWTISPPLTTDAWYAGVPRVTLDLKPLLPNTNVVVGTYDIDQNRMATLLSRYASLVPADGKVTMDLFGTDWKIPAGHRVGVLVIGSNQDLWLHVPTLTHVTVNGGAIKLPFLTHTRGETITGDKAVRLEQWLEQAPFELPQDTIDAGTSPSFALPGALTAGPSGSGTSGTGGGPGTTGGKRLKVRIARKGRRVTVYGNAPARARLVVRLRRAGKNVRVRRTRTQVNAFRTKFKVKRAGRYRAKVVVRKGTIVLRASSKRVRVTARA
jgi:predicted acyl esterase